MAAMDWKRFDSEVIFFGRDWKEITSHRQKGKRILFVQSKHWVNDI